MALYFWVSAIIVSKVVSECEPLSSRLQEQAGAPSVIDSTYEMCVRHSIKSLGLRIEAKQHLWAIKRISPIAEFMRMAFALQLFFGGRRTPYSVTRKPVRV